VSTAVSSSQQVHAWDRSASGRLMKFKTPNVIQTSHA
jgi:hypothetical protein